MTSSQNACRHGLFARPLFTDSERVEPLARQLICGDAGLEILACARAVVRSSLDLGRALRMRILLINRTLRFGRLRRSYSPNHLDQIIFTKREMWQIDRAFKAGRTPRLRRIREPKALPATEPARTAEAYRRILDDLVAIDRYERQSSARLFHALREQLKACR
jgi:hypothetical protein